MESTKKYTLWQVFTTEALEVVRQISTSLRSYNGNRFAPGYRVMKVYYFGRWRYKIAARVIRLPFSFIYKLLYRRVISKTGIELPCEVPVGKNLILEHHHGIVISGYAKIGDNCIIRNGVTIGIKNINEHVAPVIGNNVDIGTGAKVLGGISIGNNVVIGANAVVLTDVPDNCLAVGVPAKIIQR
jgi:serine O-acetyltransferase